MEDTELVGGDIPAILGGGAGLNFFVTFESSLFYHNCFFFSTGGISLDRDTADECFRR